MTGRRRPADRLTRRLTLRLTRGLTRAAAALLVALAAACGGGDGSPPPVASVRFATAADTLSAGSTRAYPADALDNLGGVLAGRGVAYASSDPGRATVDAAGLVTARAPGPVRITARSEAQTAALDLDIRPAPPARVTLAGVDSALVGDVGAVVAGVVDATGRPTTLYPVTLASNDTLVARVDSAGAVTAVGAGVAVLSARVTAPNGTVVAGTLSYVVLAPAAELRVYPARLDIAPGASAGLVAVARDAAGNRTSRRADFASTAPGIAVASGSAGGAGAQVTLSALAAGTATVTATGSFRGRNVVTATVPVAVAPVARGPFRIELRYDNPVNPAYADVFARAAAFWESVITAALPAAPVRLDADACGAGVPAVDATTAGVIISVRVDSIDGTGRVLGAAGPCLVRAAAPRLTSFGVMQFDSADVGGLVTRNLAYDVIRHEMGHVLGIGTLWNAGGRALRTGTGTAAVAYVGAGGAEGSGTLGFTDPGAPASVENAGGAGTANAHWREAVYGNELMTGFINNGANPASRLTVLSLGDLGYAVNPAAAEALLPPALTSALSRAPLAARLTGPDGVPMVDVPLLPIFVAGPDGVARRIARKGAAAGGVR